MIFLYNFIRVLIVRLPLQATQAHYLGFHPCLEKGAWVTKGTAYHNGDITLITGRWPNCEMPPRETKQPLIALRLRTLRLERQLTLR